MQKLYTTAGETLTGVPWNIYPRPQLVREDWLCLNGEWEFTHGQNAGTIRVPFCPESPLSGLDIPVRYGQEMIYRRRFTLPETWAKKRVLLHFGAVNRIAVVRLNGSTAAVHENAYLPFTADITDRLRPGENELSVHVVNDMSPRHPWGKQRIRRGGMWYTPVSGIWQTVWLEAVPQTYIRSLTVRTGPDFAEIAAEGVSRGTVLLNGREYHLAGGRVRIDIPDPILWTPETPHLYRFELCSGEDRVASYFAMRTLTVETVDGVSRLCLNGKPYFFHGVLDQGWWSDGLYTPADPGCFERDILAMKALGFNTLRKHVKVEPERFYYDCDRLGMIVFQDMVNCGRVSFLRDTLLPTLGLTRRRDLRLHRDGTTRRSFLLSMEATAALLRNHPCVCLWTIFNEGWGQFCADEMYRRLRVLDDTRFIDATSGWFRQKESDVESVHNYFRRLRPGTEPRPLLLSEFGGFVWRSPDHSWNAGRTYGYRKYASREEMVRALCALYEEQVLPLIPHGLCGAILTQLSDVEDEVNGLVTYDRKLHKVLPEELAPLSRRLTKAIRPAGEENRI